MLKRIWTGVAFFVSVGSPLDSAFGESFVYQGRFLNADGTTGLTDTVALTFSIYDPSGTCLLYQEDQPSLDLSSSDGFFSVSVGSEVGDPKRTVSDAHLSMAAIFSNSSPVPSSSHCSSGYTPAVGDHRLLRVSLFPSQGVPSTLSPDLPVYPVPTAMVAETLQGLIPSQFLQTSGTASQLAINSLTAGGDVGGSLHHHDSLYVKVGVAHSTFSMGPGSTLGLGPSSFLQLGSFSTAPTGLSTADAGKTWYDSSAQAIMFWDGSSSKKVGAGLQSLNGSAAAAQTFAIGTSGNSPTFNTSSSVHTLDIPMAASLTVTAGLLSHADYSTFFGKENSLGTAPSNFYLKGDRTWSSLAVDAKGSLSAQAPIKYSVMQGEISIATASATLSGALSTADWVRFNGKEDAISLGTTGQYWKGNKTWGDFATDVRSSISATGPLSFSTAGVISMSSAGSGQNGALSSADWARFDAKENAIAAGGNGQYWKGNKTWGDFAADVRSSISATGPLSFSTAGVISVPTANTAQTGVLSSVDYARFDGKEGAITTGTTSQYLKGDKTWGNFANDVATAGGSVFVTKAGDTMSGNLTMNGSMTLNTDLNVNGALKVNANSMGLGGVVPHNCKRFELSNTTTLNWMMNTGSRNPTSNTDVDCARFKTDGTYDTVPAFSDTDVGYPNNYNFVMNAGAWCDVKPKVTAFLTETRPLYYYPAEWRFRCVDSASTATNNSVPPIGLTATCCKL